MSSFTELLRNSSIDAIVSNLDTWKTRSSDKLLNDGTKYNYILYIIQLLKYTFDERLFRALSDDIMAAIARWGRIKSDYITGIAEERSRKHKTDVDKYEDGEMVTLTDCFLAAMKAKVKVTGLVKMTTVPSKRQLEFIYYYILLWLVLRGAIRPSAFSRMQIDEFKKAKERKTRFGDVIYIVRVFGKFLILSNTMIQFNILT